NRHGQIFLVELSGTERLEMKEAGSTGLLPTKIVTPTVLLGENVFVGTENNQLHGFSLPDLKGKQELDLGGPIAWGPYVAGTVALIATEPGMIFCIDKAGSLLWRQELNAHPVGQPLSGDGFVVLSLPQGTLVQLALSDGKEQGRIEVGQPLAAGPVVFGKRWILTAYDGTLLVVDPIQP
ncbi:MAG: PQQ-binding-like beta-propeller repeat protein, partial [Pirellulales bacterium]|nr:PQQ-binding-like beta-propeller repeat protein [Pirellulales bacterium]